MEHKIQSKFRFHLGLFSTTTIIVAIAITAVILVLQLAKIEQTREIQSWQERLSIIADNRLANIYNWIEEQYNTLNALADNQSLKLYMTQLEFAPANDNADNFQEEYLLNLISVTAERSGFLPDSTPETLKANIERVGEAGLAILDKNYRVVAATRAMPHIEDEFKDFITNASKSERSMRDMYLSNAGVPSVAFYAPIFRIQGEPTPDDWIGAVVGVKPVTKELFPLLQYPRSTEKTSESILVREENGSVLYLSPTADGSTALSKRLQQDPETLAASFALSKPGSFAIRKDYNFNEVLVTTRDIVGTPWVLLHKVNRNEALADGDRWRKNLITMCLLAVAVVTFIIVAVWRHGSSVRSKEAADRYCKVAHDFEEQHSLLKLITDSKPEPLFIVDSDNKYRFVNKEAARQADMNPDNMIGTTMSNVLGAERALQYTKINSTVLTEGKILNNIMHVTDNEGHRIIQTRHIPLDHIPNAMDRKERAGVLVLEQDITDAIRQQEGHANTLNGLVRSLVKLMDERDSYAANHSVNVAKLGRAIAEEMDLEKVMVDTTEIAGQVMNIGKMLVPTEVLTKIKKLTKKEEEQLQKSLIASADLLEDIEFDGPVRKTIKESRERWDGKGPLKLKENDILISARIIAAANAFIGLISARAYREGKSLDDALKILQDEAGNKFDRSVIAALNNYLENRGGRKIWEDMYKNSA